MQSLSPSYLVEMARQFAFLGAFLGGFAATFLATLIVSNSAKKSADWAIGSSAIAASCFVVAVIASVFLTVVLHPDVPDNISAASSLDTARVVSSLGFGLGVYALLGSVGISGWIRSRRIGIVTSVSAGLGAVLVSWALSGF